MNGHAEPPGGDYLARLEAFRRSDDDRNQMVEQLIKEHEALRLQFHLKCNDFEDAIESRRQYQDKARDAKLALEGIRQSSASNPFALAIIDGDGALFLDSLYIAGKEGGAEAAQLLHDEIRSQLRKFYPEENTSSWSIYLTIVLNMQGLAMKLQAVGRLNNPNELTAFARAFGLVQPLFQFVDVGGGKERADHKVRETLRFFLPIAQCKHVFFGPCSDNGYLPVLEPYKRDTAVKDRLTLIEARDAEPGFVDLGFKRVRFPDIFRSDNLPPIRLATNGATIDGMVPTGYGVPTRSKSSFEPTTAAFVPPSISPVSSSESTLSASMPALSPSPASNSNWATVGKAVAGKTINIASKKSATPKFIWINARDDRLDLALPVCDRAAEARIVERIKAHGNLCNSYHLGGNCSFGGYCGHHHGEALSPGEKLVLMHKARTLVCPSRSYCRNVHCYLGHRCKFGNQCSFPSCRLGDSHDVDPEPAKRVYEDGTEERIQAYLDKNSK